MAREYKTNKVTKNEPRNIQEKDNLRINSSDFLPGVFQTDLNKRRLGATLDNMLSKGSLERVEGLIGSTSGEFRTGQDLYANLPPLSTALILKSSTGEVFDIVAPSEVTAGHDASFSSYNDNGAYNSLAYMFSPPINPDKFVNHLQYYWCPDLPVETWESNTGEGIDPVTESKGLPLYSFTVGNNTYEFVNGLRIKFSGDSFHSDIIDKTYLITGVGTYINLKLMEDENGRKHFTNRVPHTNLIGGNWDSPVNVIHNGEGVNDHEAETNFDNLIAEYNTNGTKPKLRLYVESLQRGEYVYNNMPIRLGNGWDVTNDNTVYILEVDNAGVISSKVLVDDTATIDPGINDYEQLQIANEVINHWDVNPWDYKELPLSERDYHVIETSDPLSTAWSRANHWIHRDVLQSIETRLGNAFNYKEFTSPRRQAIRPIIEFNAGLQLVDAPANNIKGSDSFKGVIDVVIENTLQADDLFSGAVYYVLGESVVRTKDGTTTPLVGGEIYTVLSDLVDGESYHGKDVVYNGNTIEIIQAKLKPNQPPLFQLYDVNGVAIDDTTVYPDSDFSGNKIFGYVVGTGKMDPELGFPLSYKDSIKGADYEFKNYLIDADINYTPADTQYITKYNKPVYFKQWDKIEENYTPTHYSLGAKSYQQYTVSQLPTVTISDIDYKEIPVGRSAWEVDKEFLVGYVSNELTVSEILTEGVYNRTRDHQPTLVLAKNTTYVFHDLTSTQELMFWDMAGTEINASHPTIDYVRNGNTIEITMPDIQNYVIQYGIDGGDKGNIITNVSEDEFYHDLMIDGIKLKIAEYIIESNRILLPTQRVLEDSEFIDLQYYSSTDEYAEVPEVIEYNSKNVKVDTFTISETLDHWVSIIEHTPNITEDYWGSNTYHKSLRLDNHGGEIFIHDDLGTMYNSQYSNDKLDIARGIINQATEWWSFKNRIVSTVRRLYKTRQFQTVRELTDLAIREVTNLKYHNNLHADSNMLYMTGNNSTEYELESSQTSVNIGTALQSNRSVKDHLYVYLKENINSDDVMIERLLVENVDYTINGSVITLAQPALPGSIRPAEIRIYYNEYYKRSDVPASLPKMGLQNANVPRVESDQIVCHDGDTINITSSAELYNTLDPKFDPVAAVMYDIEQRIYGGIVSETIRFNNSAYKYMPSQHRGTWYTLEHINEGVEKYFVDWYAKKDFTTLTPENYYDAGDDTTWNYSSIDLGEHLISKLPGHWIGAYTVIFGTHRPDITPWHMLGFSQKPDWWDTHYSWTDVPKRTELLKALTYGIISEPGTPTKQDFYFARYYWDWENRCPVGTSGELISRETVLGTPAGAGTEFVFGDWGPVEQQWRLSPLGQSAFLAMTTKLNPTKAWTDFFQTNTYYRTYDSGDRTVNRYSGQLINIADIIFNDDVDQGLSVKSIEIISSGSGFPLDTTAVLYGSENIIPAEVSVNIVNGELDSISISNSGWGYERIPFIKLLSNTHSELPAYELVVHMESKNWNSFGINYTQSNELKRNNQDGNTNLKSRYRYLDVQRVQMLNGFTRSNLVNVNTETGLRGPDYLIESERPVFLHKIASEKLTASTITVEKSDSGYIISGYGAEKQQFEFYEPITSDNFSIVQLNEDTTVKRYDSYVTSQTSILKYNAKLARIQDVYNFIIGYYLYLEHNGWSFEIDKTAHALTFARWALISDIGDKHHVRVGPIVSFACNHGSPGKINLESGKASVILDMQRSQIDPGVLDITQDFQKTKIVSPSDLRVGSYNIVLYEWQHVLILANTGDFGEDLYNDVLKSSQRRYFITAERTAEWNGTLQAPGYFVNGNSINENFDTSVDDVKYYYDTNVVKGNRSVELAEQSTVNNVQREWINSLSLPANVINKFYQGAIKQAGTRNAIEKLSSINIVNQFDTTDVEIREEWMFRHSYFGDTGDLKNTEVVVNRDNLVGDSLLVDFTDNDLVYVNNQKTQQFAVENISGTPEFSGGDLLPEEATYLVNTVNELTTIFDDTADYANIETWNGTTSYKRKDRVRHRGHLYECAVDFIGYNIVSSDFDIIGTETNPIFPFATEINIDGNSILLEQSVQLFNDIVVQSVVDPEVPTPSELFINGTRISIQNTGEETVVDDTEIYQGNPFATTNTNTSYNITGLPDLIVNLGTDSNSQNVAINLSAFATQTQGTPVPPPATVSYNNVSPTSTSGAGLGITIDVVRSNADGSYTITLVDAGSGYAVDDTITFSGTLFGGASTANDIVLTVTAIQTAAGEVDTYTETGIGVIDPSTPGPSIFTLTQAQLITAITSYQDLTAQPHVLDSNRVAMVYEVNGDINKRMIVTSNATSTLLGISAATYTPVTRIQPVGEIADAAYINNLINSAGIENITSDVIGDRLVITQTATSESQATDVLTIAGQANTVLQLPASTAITSSSSGTIATLEDAVDAINNASITGVTAVAESNLIKITSTNESIDMGNTEFNSIAGLVTGIVYRQNTTVDNEFLISQWNQINEQDPALFNVWLLSDTGMENGSTGTIDSKFNNWNVLQVQNLGLYSEDDESCSICAGAATSDGNDAQITANVDINSILQVGDYVMLVNTTTQPQINGIHKITRMGNPDEPNVFYIDQFIEQCGTASQIFVLRNSRFKSYSDIQTAKTLVVPGSNPPQYVYGWESGMRVWNTENNPEPTATRVYDYDGNNFIEDYARAKTDRVTNLSLENVRIYDGETQTASIEVEVFDPLRGIIPGVAQREIDITNSNDIAAYNVSTDPIFNTVDRGAWMDEFVGTVWWDTSTIKYYDYDQGTTQDQLKNWAKQLPGSSIDVYEWTKSDVPPDEWTNAVESQKEVFGVVASGQAFERFDPTLNEQVYYYTESEEYNNIAGYYETVYYFWVKNKENSPYGRLYNTRQLAQIIRDPNSMGISWCAAINENAMVINGLLQFVNNDGSSVLQVNTDNGVMHSRWTPIEEGKDVIPDYWHVGLQDNLSGIQESTGNKLPNPELHEYNRYGDDRYLKFGNQSLSQAWFKDLPSARAEAVDVINRLLKTQNTIDTLPYTWDRTITQVSTITGTVNPDLDQQEPQIITVDLNKMWTWTSFVDSDWDDTRQASYQITAFEQLQSVDPNEHDVVLFDLSGNIGELDRSETWYWDKDEWRLVKKLNATIEFDKFFLTQQIGWDTRPYDSAEWDLDISAYIRNMIKACREDLFIEQYRDKYNDMFFAMVKYAISLHRQVDWVYKTTYVNMYIKTPVDINQKVYKRDRLNELVGYVDTVKPFHTKIRQIFDIHDVITNVDLTVTDSSKIETTIRFNQDGNDIVADPNMEFVTGSFTDVLEDEYTAGSFTEEQTDTLGQLGFGDTYVTNSEGTLAYTGNKWTLVNGEAVNRLHHVDVTVRDKLKITVTTTLDTDTATHVYLQDHYGNVTAFYDDAGTLLPIKTPVNVKPKNTSTGWDVDSGVSMLDQYATDTESIQIQDYLDYL